MKKAKGTIIPKRTAYTVEIPLIQIEHFQGGRLGVFRAWRRAIKMKAENQLEVAHVRIERVTISRGPALAVPVLYMKIEVVEVIA